ncbi:MAG: NAD-dependent epimerase/dehydratase family protein [Candidatus Aenigmarchaeota archaeon]|nr:NAD-dependent epimerase/dehydratase family protein [Candidatus Aenigmarchaeota archaeon]
MPTYLVTGGGGFIGSNIANEIARERANSVIAVDNFYMGTAENLDKSVRLVKADVKSLELAEKIDGIFHSAAVSTAPLCNKDPALAYDVNLNGFVKTMEIARKNDCRVVFASTSSLYALMPPPHREQSTVSPIEHYTNSMMMREDAAKMYAEMYGLTATGLRYFSVYGPNETHKKNFANIASQMIWSRQFDIYGDGSQSRDFIHVRDVVGANLAAFEKGKGFGIYNVGTGKETTFSRLAEIVKGFKDIQINYRPNPIDRYVSRTCADIGLIKKGLGWKPSISLEEGIKMLVGYYKEKGMVNIK